MDARMYWTSLMRSRWVRRVTRTRNGAVESGSAASMAAAAAPATSLAVVTDGFIAGTGGWASGAIMATTTAAGAGTGWANTVPETERIGPACGSTGS